MSTTIVTVGGIEMTTEDPSARSESYTNGSSIACPWCGVAHGDLWEHRLNDGDDLDVECGTCEKPFLLSLEITYDYTAKRLVPVKS